jgi:nucleoside-diphosphate-sugar epimerase
MKIILTGATGFVGNETLTQLIKDPSIERVTCLTRRELKTQSEKIHTVILKDFTSYDSKLAAELANHNGCIWTLGGKTSDLGTEEFEKITTTFTLSLANAIAQNATSSFRFCYLSGMGADPTETTRLPWEKLTRHMKGRTERLLEEVTLKRGFFHATAFRPAGILPKRIHPVASLLLSPIAIGVERLSRSMISEIKSEPAKSFRVLSNSQIKKLSST